MIRYEPARVLNRLAPIKKIKKILKTDLSINKTALAFVDDLEFVSKKKVATVALKVIKGYKERIKSDPNIKDDIVSDPAQLIQRVQNEVAFQVKEEIKDTYSGEFYVWLPSDAEEPDPEHQLNYGKTFRIGEGEMPGDRWGCRCGMEILVPDKTLQLGEAA